MQTPNVVGCTCILDKDGFCWAGLDDFNFYSHENRSAYKWGKGHAPHVYNMTWQVTHSEMYIWDARTDTSI